MNELKYKNIKGFLHNLYSFFKSNNEAFVILTLSSISLILALGLAPSLMLSTVLLLMAGILLSVKLNSVFAGFFLVLIYSFGLVNPSKFYLIEVLKGYEIQDAYFVGGRLLRYGIYSSNIFLGLSLLFMTLESFRKKDGVFLATLRSKMFGFVLPAVGFLLFGVGISIIKSPFATLSTVWTVQYFQIFLVAAVFVFFYLKHKNKFNLFLTVICFNIFLQFVISTIQFFRQSSLGIPIEAVEKLQLPQALDLPSFYRATGTYGVSIQLALITLIYLVIIIPQTMVKKKLLYLISAIAACVILILSQSRTGWVGATFTIILALKFYSKKVKLLVLNSYRKIFVYLMVAVSVLSFVFIPRILSSLNTGYEGGGLPLRQKMIKEGIEAFSLSPILGYGAGTNESVLYSLFPDGVINTFPLPVLEGHLQLLLEFGILGTFFLFLPFYLTTRKIVNAMIKDKGFFIENKSFIISFLTGMVLINLHYLFQSHDGVIEFGLLGLVLGVGMIAGYSKSWYKEAIK